MHNLSGCPPSLLPLNLVFPLADTNNSAPEWDCLLFVPLIVGPLPSANSTAEHHFWTRFSIFHKLLVHKWKIYHHQFPSYSQEIWGSYVRHAEILIRTFVKEFQEGVRMGTQNRTRLKSPQRSIWGTSCWIAILKIIAWLKTK